jgi:hypothetical protein
LHATRQYRRKFIVCLEGRVMKANLAMHISLRRALIVTCIVVLALLGAGGGYAALLHKRATGKIEDYRSSLTMAGIPVTHEAAMPYWASVAGKENAAAHFESVYREYSAPGRRLGIDSPMAAGRIQQMVMGEIARSLHYRQAWPADLRERAEQYLSRNEACLRTLRSTLAIPSLRFEFDSQRGIPTPDVASLTRITEFMRLLDWEIRAACLSGESERATLAIIDMARLGDTLIGLPFVEALAYQSRIWRRAQVTVFGAYSCVPFNEDQLSRIHNAFEHISTYNGFQSYMAWKCPQVSRDSMNENNLAQLVVSQPNGAIRELGLLVDLADYWGDGAAERWRRANLAASTVRKRIKDAASVPSAGDWEDVAGSDALEYRFANEARILVYAQHFFDAGSAAIAIMQYRARNAAWPADLNSLIPEYAETVPIDVWTGEPIRYRSDDKGFLLLSVGENGSDDTADTAIDPDELYDVQNISYTDDEFIAIRLPDGN